MEWARRPISTEWDSRCLIRLATRPELAAARSAGAAAAVVVAAAVLAAPMAAGASVNPTPESSAAVTGTIYAMARVGTRTIIGGDFTAVGGVARKNAAAIRADGTLDPSFKPNPNGIVQSIAVSADSTRVFLGGTFTRGRRITTGQPGGRQRDHGSSDPDLVRRGER